MSTIKSSTFLLLLVLTQVYSESGSKQVVFSERVTPVGSHIGQVGGLDTDHNGNLIVFHRATRKWAFDSFFNDNFNRLLIHIL